MPQAAVAVVPEDRDDAFPDVGDLVERHPDTEPLGDLRVRREPAADPEVEARTVLGVHGADEGDVVDLVGDVLLPRDRRLELPGQVRERLVADVALEDRVDRRLRVDLLVRGDPCHRRAEDHAGRVAARLRGDHPEALEALPDRRHALDLDPVVLDVLPIRDVRGVARVGLADLTEGAQLLRGERAAVEPDTQHEVAVVELLGLQHRGAAAVDPGAALRVEAPPAHPAAQVGRVDRVEPALAVDVLDPGADVQPVVVLLGALVRVERLAVAELPLAFTALALGRSRPAGCGRAGGHVPASGSRPCAATGASGSARRRGGYGRGTSGRVDRERCSPGAGPRGGGPRGAGSAQTCSPECHLGRPRSIGDRILGVDSHGPVAPPARRPQHPPLDDEQVHDPARPDRRPAAATASAAGSSPRNGLNSRK